MNGSNTPRNVRASFWQILLVLGSLSLAWPQSAASQSAAADSLAGHRATAFPLLVDVPSRGRAMIDPGAGAITGLATLSATGIFEAVLAIQARGESDFHGQVIFTFRSHEKGDLFQLQSPAYSPSGRAVLREELRDTLPLEVVYFTDTIVAISRPLPSGAVNGKRSSVDRTLQPALHERLAAAGVEETELRASLQEYNTPFRYNILPAPSETYRLDRFFKGRTLLEAGEKLSAALADKSCGYTEQAFYDFPYGHGFVLVTRLEQINPENATPKQPGRWSTRLNPLEAGFSLTSYLKALFFADDGHFRLLLFVFSDGPLLFDEVNKQPISRDEGTDLLRNGDPQLSAAYSGLSFDDGYHCTALIYEFEQSEFTHSVQLLEKSPLGGVEHLRGAGLLATLRN